MSTKPKSKYPIESFGPELLTLLLKVGRGETVVLTFPQRKLATRFRMRVHMFRQRMRETDHPDYIVASRARLSLKYNDNSGPNDPAILTIRPFDEEFSDILREAKILAPTLDDDPLNKI